jgi:hypothetical protein
MGEQVTQRYEGLEHDLHAVGGDGKAGPRRHQREFLSQRFVVLHGALPFNAAAPSGRRLSSDDDGSTPRRWRLVTLLKVALQEGGQSASTGS